MYDLWSVRGSFRMPVSLSLSEPLKLKRGEKKIDDVCAQLWSYRNFEFIKHHFPRCVAYNAECVSCVSCVSRDSFLWMWMGQSKQQENQNDNEKNMSRVRWDVPRIVAALVEASIVSVWCSMCFSSKKNHLIKIVEPAIFIFQHCEWMLSAVFRSLRLLAVVAFDDWLVFWLFSHLHLLFAIFPLNCPCVVYSFACVTSVHRTSGKV